MLSILLTTSNQSYKKATLNTEMESSRPGILHAPTMQTFQAELLAQLSVPPHTPVTVTGQVMHHRGPHIFI